MKTRLTTCKIGPMRRALYNIVVPEVGARVLAYGEVSFILLKEYKMTRETIFVVQNILIL